MAITSVGYDGAVTESQWSDMIKKIGSAEYGVVGTNDWKVTSVPAADRTIAIAAGKGWGHGVYDTNTASVQIQLDTVSSGSRWDMIAMRRDWTGTGGSSTYVKVNGTSTKAIPVGRTTGSGVIDEQPIALVRVTAGSTVVAEIIDLRVWAGNGGMVMRHDLALGYLKTLGTAILDSGTGRRYTRAIGPDGNALWTTTPPDGYIPMFGIGSALAGGVPAAGTSFLIQSGSVVQRFDAGGYARITFPNPFPNGLLYVAGFNGDSWATGGFMDFASAGSVWGPEGYGTKASWVYTGRSQDTTSKIVNNVPAYGDIHRINWLAIGW